MFIFQRINIALLSPTRSDGSILQKVAGVNEPKIWQKAVEQSDAIKDDYGSEENDEDLHSLHLSKLPLEFIEEIKDTYRGDAIEVGNLEFESRKLQNISGNNNKKTFIRKDEVSVHSDANKPGVSAKNRKERALLYKVAIENSANKEKFEEHKLYRERLNPVAEHIAMSRKSNKWIPDSFGPWRLYKIREQ